MSDVDIEEFGASADMAAAIVDPAIAPEPEFDVGREQVSLPVQLLAAQRCGISRAQPSRSLR